MPALFQPLELSSTRPKSLEWRIFSTGGGFLKWCYPQIIHLFRRVFHYFHHPFWGVSLFLETPRCFWEGKMGDFFNSLEVGHSSPPRKTSGWKTNYSPLLLGIVTNLGASLLNFGGCSCVFWGRASKIYPTFNKKLGGKSCSPVQNLAGRFPSPNSGHVAPVPLPLNVRR